jgi:hypothetical protein
MHNTAKVYLNRKVLNSIIGIVLLCCSISLNAQFTQIPNPAGGYVWVDVNNDGVLEPRDGVWGDYDNDNTIDVILDNILYHNDGQGNLTPVLNSGLPNYDNMQFAWGDYDNDGDLEIYC